MHTGAYECVTDAYECIRMHTGVHGCATDAHGCIQKHMDVEDAATGLIFIDFDTSRFSLISGVF